MQAYALIREDRREKALQDQKQFDEHTPDFTTRTDGEARKLADTPHLTGDPEWDAVELAETDPSRPLLSERMGG